MPNYSEYVESIGAGPSSIDVRYEITDNVVTVSYPDGTFDGTEYTNAGTASVKLRGYSSSPFRQSTKIPESVTIDPCDPTGTTWYVSGYSADADRIVYIGEDLTEKLNNNYTGCCFDQDGNQYSEPSLNQARTMDIVLEGLQFDQYGKFTYASMPNDFYKNGCTTVPLASITRSETFTVTFNGMTPNIASSAPYLDDDITVTLERSDGTSVTATSSTGTITMSAVAPQTITIKLGGKFGKKLFPEETWEYYYEKNSEFTAVPEHENFEVSYDDRKPDPNEFIEPYRIDKDNNTGSNLNDLSQEVPSGVSILKYEGDVTEREAGTNPIDGSLSRAGHRDISFKFSVTSSIPGISSTPWSLSTSLATGSYCTNGGSTYYVELGGTPGQGSPGSPGDPNAVPPVPAVDPVPADSGPSGSGFFIDESGMRYRHVPSQGLVTTFGAGAEYDMILYVMNDYLIGQGRFDELLDASDARRNK